LPTAVTLHQVGPCVRLGGADEREEFGAVEAERRVKIALGGPLVAVDDPVVAAVLHEPPGDVLLEVHLLGGRHQTATGS